MEHALHGLSGTGIDRCYQCAKCTAGCPVAPDMDYAPNRLFRLVQLGQLDAAAACEAIWLCVSCLTCVARCPQEVDCVAVIDALRTRAIARAENAPAQARIVEFYRTFLDNIRRNGRINELELAAQVKIRGFWADHSVSLLFKDSLLAPKLFQRGKLHLAPSRPADRDVVKRIFERCEVATARAAEAVAP